LPAHFYFELTTKMREFQQAFAQQVEQFLARALPAWSKSDRS
jgi:hypothetical protein